MGQPDQLGSQSWPDSRKRKSAIVEAAAHAQPTTETIKSHQWKQYGVECPWWSLQSFVEGWFRNAKAVGCQLGAIGKRAENQPAAVHRMQHRQIEVDASPAGNMNVHLGINFTVVGQVDGNVASPEKVGMFQQVQRKLVGSDLLFFHG